MRTNRTEDCFLENAKLFKKRNRKYHQYYSEKLKHLIIVRRRDNNVVTIGSCIYLHIVVIYVLRNGGDHYLYLGWKLQIEMHGTYIYIG